MHCLLEQTASSFRQGRTSWPKGGLAVRAEGRLVAGTRRVVTGGAVAGTRVVTGREVVTSGE